MKKLITFIIMASLAFTVQAQDITNTLGNNGKFILKTSTGETFLNTYSPGNSAQFSTLIIGMDAFNNWAGSDFAPLQIQHSSTTAESSIFRMIGKGAINHIRGQFSRFDGSVEQSVEDNDHLLYINGDGYNNGGYREAASIQFNVDGTPSGNYVPGEIQFLTGTSATNPDVRMTIKSDGRVNIATVLQLTPGSAPASPQEGDIYINSTDHHIYCYLNGTWKQLDN